MKKTEKKKIAGAGLYIVLAACVLSAMTINVVNNARQKKTEDAPKTSAVDVKTDGVEDDTEKVAKAQYKISRSETASPELAEKRLPQSKEASPKRQQVIETPQKSDEPEPEKQTGANDEKKYKTYICPVNGEVGEYDNNAIVFSETFRDYRVHDGIDIAAELGADVAAFAAGTVKSVYDDALMGKVVEIDHGGGLVSVYKNLSEDIPESVKAGASVATGDVIGKIGATAVAESASEPHLHFEVCFNEASIDPTTYFTEGK